MKLTLQDLINIGDVYKAIQFADSHKKDYPKMQMESPRLPNKPTAEDYIKYGQELKPYEEAKAKHKEEVDEIRKYNQEISNLIIDFIKDQSGLKDLPEIKQNKVWSKAYEEGRSSGYYEVYNELVDLIELVK